MRLVPCCWPCRPLWPWTAGKAADWTETLRWPCSWHPAAGRSRPETVAESWTPPVLHWVNPSWSYKQETHKRNIQIGMGKCPSPFVKMHFSCHQQNTMEMKVQRSKKECCGQFLYNEIVQVGCVPVKEHRDPLHGNNDWLAVRGLWVRVCGATSRAGFLLAWEQTNMTCRDTHHLCYGRAGVNLTSNPCHVWTWCKHRWEDDKEVENGGGAPVKSVGEEVRFWAGKLISQDSD